MKQVKHSTQQYESSGIFIILIFDEKWFFFKMAPRFTQFCQSLKVWANSATQPINWLTRENIF